jgi:hypothetical protein
MATRRFRQSSSNFVQADERRDQTRRYERQELFAPALQTPINSSSSTMKFIFVRVVIFQYQVSEANPIRH